MADSKGRRKEVANRLKTQCVLSNYGLPDGVPRLNGLSTIEACRKIRAIHELWIRFDLWVETGEASKGSIDYPEARRRIDYDFVGADRDPNHTKVLFKALIRSGESPVRMY